MNNKITALIVEDDLGWQDDYRKLLEERGVACVSAINLGQALERIKRQRFALAIVDMNFGHGAPSDQGLEVLAEIRNRNDGTAVIVSTSYSDLEVAVASFEKYHIDKYFQKRHWTQEVFNQLIDAALAKREELAKQAEQEERVKQGLLSVRPKSALAQLVDFGRLSNEWFERRLRLEELLSIVGKDAEPLVPETLAPAIVSNTLDGETLLAFGWSRGFGAPVAIRMGKLETIKKCSGGHKEYGLTVLEKLSRPIRKVRPPYYHSRLGVLVVELVGIHFGQVSLLGTLFHNREYERFLAGLQDLLNVSCNELYRLGSRTELKINLADQYSRHLAELTTRREQRRVSERQQLADGLRQLGESERAEREKDIVNEERERQTNLISAGFPSGYLLMDALEVLKTLRIEVGVSQTLASQQLSVFNTYVDENNQAWPVFGGWLREGSPAIELAELETELKYSVLSSSSISTYVAIEKRLDVADSSTDILDEQGRTMLEAIRLIRTLARIWQPDDRFYRFQLALQALRIAETSASSEKRNGALLSAAWHADRIRV